MQSESQASKSDLLQVIEAVTDEDVRAAFGRVANVPTDPGEKQIQFQALRRSVSGRPVIVYRDCLGRTLARFFDVLMWGQRHEPWELGEWIDLVVLVDLEEPAQLIPGFTSTETCDIEREFPSAAWAGPFEGDWAAD